MRYIPGIYQAYTENRCSRCASESGQGQPGPARMAAARTGMMAAVPLDSELRDYYYCLPAAAAAGMMILRHRDSVTGAGQSLTVTQ
jgi:hypothetical protein